VSCHDRIRKETYTENNSILRKKKMYKISNEDIKERERAELQGGITKTSTYEHISYYTHCV